MNYQFFFLLLLSTYYFIETTTEAFAFSMNHPLLRMMQPSHITPATTATTTTSLFLFHQKKISFRIPSSSSSSSSSSSLVVLHAGTKKKRTCSSSNNNDDDDDNTIGFGKKKNLQSSSSSLVCPCGSQQLYHQCCGLIHSNTTCFIQATPEQVVRARYSAYALRKIDFIILSTHSQNQDFKTDIQHWKTQIRKNGYDNFILTQCKILNESFEDHMNTTKTIATVTFIAHMIQRDIQEKMSFMEISTFEKGNILLHDDKSKGKEAVVVDGDAWLYKSGIVQTVPLDL